MTNGDSARQERSCEIRQRQRAELAREVHDVVGHAMTVIHVQAAAALELLGGEHSDMTAPVLASIKMVSRQALQDLRGVLALIEHPAGIGLDRLRALAGQVGDCGLTVELKVVGERPVPHAIGLAAYRIVQESLTNVLRHAGPATASVEVRYEPDVLVVEISDDGCGPGWVGGNGGNGEKSGNGGYGIRGMRGRARALGGTLEAAPCGTGGFRVLASLPLDTVRHGT